MHINIDRSLCTGHGRCFSLAPAVFGYDDDGYSVLKTEIIGPDLEADASRAASACPERAIIIEDS